MNCKSWTLVGCFIACCAPAWGQTFRDDFDASHDYSTGTVPGGGPWTGVHNPAAGGSTFNANTTTAGNLHFGTNEVGWGGSLTSAPMLFREVDASQFREVSAKVTNQTAGFWSTSGVIARVQTGDVSDGDYSDENFVTAASFLTGGVEFGGNGASLQGQNIVGPVRTQELNTDLLTAADVSNVRLVHHGLGEFELFSSSDGTNWTSRHFISKPTMATGLLEVGVYGGDNQGAGAGLLGTNEFDWAEVVVGTRAPDPTLQWSLDQSGNWNAANWDVLGGAPDSNITTAILGATITDVAAIYNDADVTVKGLQFDNANTYTVGGTGSLTLEADSGSASIDVLQGSHQIQQEVILNSNTDATAAGGSQLDINGHLDVNGNILAISGDVFLNNGIDLGGGSILVSGALTVGGFANLDDGSLEVGSAALAALAGSGTPILTADSLSADGLTLGGSAAGQYSLLRVDNSLLVTAIPEPSTIAILALGMGSVFVLRRRRSMASLLIAAVVCLIAAPSAQAQVFRDDFDVFHDYSGASGGTAGDVSGTIWDGIHNPTNGGDANFPGYFVANGADFNGVPKPGVLFIEDLSLHENPDLSLGVGWEFNKTSAPFLYKEAPAEKDFEAVMKISAETAGFWSTTGLMARVQGPTTGRGPGDTEPFADENFVNAGTFRTDEANPNNATLIAQNIVAGVESETNQNLFPPANGGAPLPVWVKLEKAGTLFTSSMSLDGVTYETNPSLQFVNPAFVEGETMEIGLGHWRYGGSTGEAEIDFVEIDIFDAITVTSAIWDVDASGEWQNFANWDTDVSGFPESNQAVVTLGGAISAPRSVFSTTDMKAKSVTFDSAHQYAITGAGTLILEADSGNAALNASQGTHEVQVSLNLASSTDSAVSSGGRIDLNNAVDLGGNTLAVSGDGWLNFNNNLDTGTSGQVNSTGNIGGTGTINGGLANQAGGNVGPGLSIGELNVDGAYTQAATASLEIEIGVDGSDLLSILGAATLDGLLDVSLLDGFSPTAGAMYTVLTASSITDNGLTLSGSASSNFSMAVNVDSIVLTALSVVGLPGDFNDDGMVNLADYAVWRDNLGAANDGGLNGNGDGINGVDAGDYNLWKTSFGNPGSAASQGNQAVPEPTTIGLILLAIGGLVLSRRR